MHIENPEALLKRPIIGRDGQMWIVTECNRYADVENGPYYEFTFVTDEPVKSSPNQQYYHMTKLKTEKAELRLFKYQTDGHLFELRCNGQSQYGPIGDINTKDKFIIKIVDMLPVCY